MEELADTAPGPDLFARLEAADPRACTGAELVGLVEAQARQVAYQQSRLLLTVRELAHASKDSTARRELVDAYADTELAFALTITDYAAGVLLSAATAAVDKHPALLEASAAGRVDLAKVSMITSELSEVQDDTARAILDQLLPDIDLCTLAQLRDKLRTLILAVDPDNVRTRTKKGQDDRDVDHAEYANGTFRLVGRGRQRRVVPVGHVPGQGARRRVGAHHRDREGHKAAGDPAKRDLDQLRADVFADLLAGVDPTLAGAATPADRNGAIYLHINTTTLACLDDHPGQLEGFGPVIADIARQTAAQLAEHAQWRFVVEDDDGQTVAEGRLRYRPTLGQTMFVNARDRTCRAPGCRRPARACDRDHVKDRAHGGPTTIANLCCLCGGTTGPNTSASSASAVPSTASTGPRRRARPTPSCPNTAKRPNTASPSCSAAPSKPPNPANSDGDEPSVG